jgi:perosamine synthetase
MNQQPRQVPVNTPLITEGDIASVVNALRDGWVSGEGPIVAEFENSFAQSCNREFGIAVTNGTAAIELVIHALGIGPGDEVILPSFAIISCVSQILRAGATPVFVDSDAATWNMDVNQIRSVITANTRAIMAVHTYGLPVDMDPLLQIAEEFNLKVIEDAAESHGLQYRGQRCGSFGLVSTFSFYANKHITTGEGGMVVTNDEELAASIRKYRNLAFQPERRFVHDELGWNLRMSSLQCALGTSQLQRLEEILASRRATGRTYQDAFKDLRNVQLPLPRTATSTNDYWVFGLVLNGDLTGRAGEIQQVLSENGVGTRPFFWPLHEQPVLKTFGLSEQPLLPIASNLARSGFYIPNGLGLNIEDIEHVIETVRRVLS